MERREDAPKTIPPFHTTNATKATEGRPYGMNSHIKDGIARKMEANE
jgi:hypothetical protein